MNNLFVDANILLDYLLERGEAGTSAKEIFKLAHRGILQVSTSSSNLINTLYILKKAKVSN